MSAAVLRIGSGLLADAKGWRHAAAAAAEALTGAGGGAVVVASPRHLRDLLGEAFHHASRGDGARAGDAAARLRGASAALARDLGRDGFPTPGEVRVLKRLEELVQGAALVGYASPRTRAGASALLHRHSALGFADLLDARGCRVQVHLEPPVAGPRDGIAVVPGEPGPGASDLRAVRLAEAWGLEEVHLWDAEDGICAADPDLVPGARVLPALSHEEARALSGFGARHLHPAVLARASAADLDLLLSNLHRPGASTRIGRGTPLRTAGSIVSVAYKEGLHLLRLPAEAGLAGLTEADAELREAGAITFGAIAGPEGSLLVVRAETEAAVRALAAREDRGAGLASGWALVALVGEGLRASPGAALRLLAPLRLERVGGLLAGSSPISVSFLVPEERLPELIPRLHSLWVEAPGVVRGRAAFAF